MKVSLARATTSAPPNRGASRDNIDVKLTKLLLSTNTPHTAAMFKKEYAIFSLYSTNIEAKQKRSISGGAKSKVKSSAQRAIRSKVLEEYPKLEPYIEDILPKKEQLDLVKLYVYLITTTKSVSCSPYTT